MTLADRVASAYLDSMRRYADRAPGRFSGEVAGLPVVSLGLPEQWANVVLALAGPPEPAAVDEALGWFVARGLDAQVVVRVRDVAVLSHRERVDEMPALVAPLLGVQELLSVRRAASAAEFREIYAAAFAMRPGLAEGLVFDADIGAEGMIHLVGTSRGEPVACALLRPDDGLGYVSAVGVLPAEQGRGFGTAMLAACAEASADAGCDQVWLHASDRTVGFYEGIGFELVDTHVALA